MLMPWNQIYKQASFTLNAKWEYIDLDYPEPLYTQWHSVSVCRIPVLCEVCFYRMHKFPVAFKFLPMRFHKIDASYMRLVFDHQVYYKTAKGFMITSIVDQPIPNKIAQLVGNAKLRETRAYVADYLATHLIVDYRP